MTELLPAFFLAHGNPMLTLGDNEATRLWHSLPSTFSRPRFILCISAHWETDKPSLTSAARLETIHDFYGFPEALFQVEYTPSGDPALAADLASRFGLALDPAWGIDHGAWSVLRHMYPLADVPVLQLSLGRNLSFAAHFDLGKKISTLRGEGGLIIGSGNIVHNLRQLVWKQGAPPHEWALSFHTKVKQALEQADNAALIEVEKRVTDEARLSVPTFEHFSPLLYIAATRQANEAISFPLESLDMASLSMLSVRVG